ncbi:MAG: hypothetical protein DRP72_01020, partial [Candidatus Omnitrophota bacterium]
GWLRFKKSIFDKGKKEKILIYEGYYREYEGDKEIVISEVAYRLDEGSIHYKVYEGKKWGRDPTVKLYLDDLNLPLKSFIIRDKWGRSLFEEKPYREYVVIFVKNNPGKMWIFYREINSMGKIGEIKHKIEDFVQGKEIPEGVPHVVVLSKDEMERLVERSGILYLDGKEELEKPFRYGENKLRGAVIEKQWHHIKFNSFISNLLHGRWEKIGILPSVVIIGAAVFLVPIGVAIFIVLSTQLFTLGLRNKFRKLIFKKKKIDNSILANSNATSISSESESSGTSEDEILEKIMDERLGALSYRTLVRKYLKEIIKAKGFSVDKNKQEIEEMLEKFAQFFNVLIYFQHDEELLNMRKGLKKIKNGRWVLDDEEIDNLFLLYDENDLEHPFNSDVFKALQFSGVLELKKDIVMQQVVEKLVSQIKRYLDKKRAEGKLVELPHYPLKGLLNLSWKIIGGIIAVEIILALLGVISGWFAPLTLIILGSLRSSLLRFHLYDIPKAILTIIKERKNFDQERAEKEKDSLAFKSYFWERIIKQWIIFNSLIIAGIIYYAWGMVPTHIFAIGFLLVLVIARISFRSIAFLNFAALIKIIAEEEKLYQVRTFEDVKKKAEELFTKYPEKREEFNEWVRRELYGDKEGEEWFGNYISDESDNDEVDKMEIYLKQPPHTWKLPANEQTRKMMVNWFNQEFMPKPENWVVEDAKTLTKAVEEKDISKVKEIIKRYEEKKNRYVFIISLIEQIKSLISEDKIEEARRVVRENNLDNLTNLNIDIEERNISGIENVISYYNTKITQYEEIIGLLEELKDLIQQGKEKEFKDKLFNVKDKMYDYFILLRVVQHNAVDEQYEVMFGNYSGAPRNPYNELDSREQRKPGGVLAKTRFRLVKENFLGEWRNFIKKLNKNYGLKLSTKELDKLCELSLTAEETYKRIIYYYLYNNKKKELDNLEDEKGRRIVVNNVDDFVKKVSFKDALDKDDKNIVIQIKHFCNWRLENVWKTVESSWYAFRRELGFLVKEMFPEKANDSEFIEEKIKEKIKFIIIYTTYAPTERKADERNSISIYQHIEEYKEDNWKHNEDGYLVFVSLSVEEALAAKYGAWNRAKKYIKDAKYLFALDSGHRIEYSDIRYLTNALFYMEENPQIAAIIPALYIYNEHLTGVVKANAVGEKTWNIRIQRAKNFTDAEGFYGKGIWRVEALEKAQTILSNYITEDTVSSNQAWQKGYKVEQVEYLRIVQSAEKVRFEAAGFILRFGGPVVEMFLGQSFQNFLRSSKVHWAEKLGMIFNFDHYFNKNWIVVANILIFFLAFFTPYNLFTYLAGAWILALVGLIACQAINAQTIVGYQEDRGFWEGIAGFMKDFAILFFYYTSFIPEHYLKVKQGTEGLGVFTFSPRVSDITSKSFKEIFIEFKFGIAMGVFATLLILLGPYHPVAWAVNIFFVGMALSWWFTPFMMNPGFIGIKEFKFAIITGIVSALILLLFSYHPIIWLIITTLGLVVNLCFKWKLLRERIKEIWEMAGMGDPMGMARKDIREKMARTFLPGGAGVYSPRSVPNFEARGSWIEGTDPKRRKILISFKEGKWKEPTSKEIKEMEKEGKRIERIDTLLAINAIFFKCIDKGDKYRYQMIEYLKENNMYEEGKYGEENKYETRHGGGATGFTIEVFKSGIEKHIALEDVAETKGKEWASRQGVGEEEIWKNMAYFGDEQYKGGNDYIFIEMKLKAEKGEVDEKWLLLNIYAVPLLEYPADEEVERMAKEENVDRFHVYLRPGSYESTLQIFREHIENIDKGLWAPVFYICDYDLTLTKGELGKNPGITEAIVDLLERGRYFIIISGSNVNMQMERVITPIYQELQERKIPLSRQKEIFNRIVIYGNGGGSKYEFELDENGNVSCYLDLEYTKRHQIPEEVKNVVEKKAKQIMDSYIGKTTGLRRIGNFIKYIVEYTFLGNILKAILAPLALILFVFSWGARKLALLKLKRFVDKSFSLSDSKLKDKIKSLKTKIKKFEEKQKEDVKAVTEKEEEEIDLAKSVMRMYEALYRMKRELPSEIITNIKQRILEKFPYYESELKKELNPLKILSLSNFFKESIAYLVINIENNYSKYRKEAKKLREESHNLQRELEELEGKFNKEQKDESFDKKEELKKMIKKKKEELEAIEALRFLLEEIVGLYSFKNEKRAIKEILNR